MWLAERMTCCPQVCGYILLPANLLHNTYLPQCAPYAQACCAVCLIDATAAEEHPLLRRYQAALDPSDLRHLVLSSRGAQDAAAAAAAYLAARRGPVSGPEAFSLRDDGAGTFQFALEVARWVAAGGDGRAPAPAA